MSSGWECPRCGNVHGPHVDTCGCGGAAIVRAVHYGVRYQCFIRRPTQVAVHLGCGSYNMGGLRYELTRDWNQVSCRRCLKSRATAAGPAGFAARNRIETVRCAPDGDPILGHAHVVDASWHLPYDAPAHEPCPGGYGQPPRVGERCSAVWWNICGQLQCGLLDGHGGPHKYDLDACR